MADSENPIVTWHAGNRWDRRTPEDSVAPETAWQHGVRVCGPERGMGVDEIRVHEPSGAVLLRNENRIVTIKEIRRLQPDAASAVEPVLNGRSA